MNDQTNKCNKPQTLPFISVFTYFNILAYYDNIKKITGGWILEEYTPKMFIGQLE